MFLKKCPNNHYTLKEECPKCKEKTKNAHYKFIKIKTKNKKMRGVFNEWNKKLYKGFWKNPSTD